jgi:hypothetical protein
MAPTTRSTTLLPSNTATDPFEPIEVEMDTESPTRVETLEVTQQHKRRAVDSLPSLANRQGTAFQFQPTNQQCPSVQRHLDTSLHHLTAAAAAEDSPQKKKRLLDFINIFREFTEEGRVNYAASALQANIQTLETVTRKLQKAPLVLGTQNTQKATLNQQGLPQSYA